VNYGELIGEAFSIAWRNRFLWFFGLFAGTTVGSLGAPLNSGGTFPAEEGNRSMPSLGTFVGPAREWAAENVLAISLVAGLVLLVILVFIAVGALCTGALADSVAAIDRGEGRRFTSTFRAGLWVFPRTMGLLLIYSALYVFLLLIVGGSMLFLFLISSPEPLPSQIASVFNALALAVVLVFVIFIPLGIVGQLAIRDAVVGGERVFASIGTATASSDGTWGRACSCGSSSSWPVSWWA
jgi:hypothetical protein